MIQSQSLFYMLAVVTLLILFVNAKSKGSGETDDPDVCIHHKTNKFFGDKWCKDLSKKEACRLGLVNLIFAATSGDVKALKRYYDDGLDMNLADYDKRAAIHLAVAEGHLEATKFLLEVAKVKASPKDRWGHRPMDEARRFKRTDIIKYLESREK